MLLRSLINQLLLGRPFPANQRHRSAAAAAKASGRSKGEDAIKADVKRQLEKWVMIAGGWGGSLSLGRD